MKWSVTALMEHGSTTETLIGGRWVPARPIVLTTFWERLGYAWGVLLRRYDAVEWDGQ